MEIERGREKELDDRVKNGEDETTVKRELQTKKAQASAERKAAAAAVAAKCALQSAQSAAAKAKAKANAKKSAKGAAAQTAPSGAAMEVQEESELNDAANKAYYCQVLEDCQLVLSEFGGEDFRKEMPLAITDQGGATSGVQEPFNRSKALAALSAHGCYRASISIWWVNPLASPTPGVPMSRRRVEDLAEFYYGPEGEPKFHTERMIEVAIAKSDCDTDHPSGLQMVSPEELLHSTFCGCARAIKLLWLFRVKVKYKFTVIIVLTNDASQHVLRLSVCSLRHQGSRECCRRMPISRKWRNGEQFVSAFLARSLR